MNIELEKRPKNPIIITGFPGFGLVATISTEFLIEHLGAKKIGRISIEESPPIVAVHKGNVIDPIGIYYDAKNNLLVIHAVAQINGSEWKLAEAIQQLAIDLKAKEVISIEGVGGEDVESKSFYYTNFSKKFEKTGMKHLDEGIIMGVTGALLLKKDLKLSCIFAETHSALPDSKAAAKIIECLDKYLGLKVNPDPLLEKAEKFESKLKDIFSKSKVATKEKAKKELSYLG